jgi:hypothetical protein
MRQSQGGVLLREIGSERDLPPRIWRLIQAFDDEIRTTPIGYRRPFSILKEIVLELADRVSSDSKTT